MDGNLVPIPNVKSRMNVDMYYGERLAGGQTKINKVNNFLSSASRTSLKFSSYRPENTFLTIVNFLLVRNARFVRKV